MAEAPIIATLPYSRTGLTKDLKATARPLGPRKSLTWYNNILDLVLSNNNNIHNNNVIPGISDHDAGQFQLSVTHKSTARKPPHKGSTIP